MSDHGRIALDLTNFAWRRHVRGGYSFYGTWFRGEDGWEPCLAIVPSFQVISHTRTTPCVVLLRDAYRWAEPSPYVAEQCGIFLAAMGLSFDGRRAAGLAMAVHDHLGDLLAMPPHPPELKEAVAEIVGVDNATGREFYATVHDMKH